MDFRLFMAIAALLSAVSAVADSHAPVVVYHGGATAPVVRPVPAPQSNGILIDYLVDKEIETFQGRRAELAKAQYLDYALEYTFAYRCLGIADASDGCRSIYVVDSTTRGVDLNLIKRASTERLGAIVIDHHPGFGKGKLFVSAQITLVPRDGVPHSGTKWIMNIFSDRAPAGARANPIYKKSNKVSDSEARNRSAAREYWFDGEPSAFSLAYQQQLGVIAETLSHILEIDNAHDKNAMDTWFRSLKKGKQAHADNGEKCPRACGQRMMSLGDGKYLVVNRFGHSGAQFDYGVYIL